MIFILITLSHDTCSVDRAPEDVRKGGSSILPRILRGLSAIACICQASMWKIIEETLKYKGCIVRLQKGTYSTKVNLRDLLNEPLSTESISPVLP